MAPPTNIVLGADRPSGTIHTMTLTEKQPGSLLMPHMWSYYTATALPQLSIALARETALKIHKQGCFHALLHLCDAGLKRGSVKGQTSLQCCVSFF